MSIFSTPLGAEIFVNTRTANIQWDPSLTELSDGTVLIGWGSAGGGLAREALFQRFSANGARIGGETSVPTSFGSSPDSPIAVARPSGFTVIYEYFQNGNDQSIAAVNFGPGGAVMGSSFGFRSGSYGHNNTLDVAALPDGGSIVSWTDRSRDSTEAYLRRFDANFQATGPDIQLDFPGAEFEGSVSAAGLPSGIFAATWVATNVEGLEDAVYLRIFNAGGAARSPYITVGQEEGLRRPEIAALADGTFVVVTESRDSGILAQRYNTGGARVGEATLVNVSPTDFNNAIQVAALPGGGFVVVWSDTENRQDHILGRAFDAQGNPDGGEVRISTTGTDNEAPEVMVLESGTVVVAWQGSDADGAGVTARLFRDPNAPTQGPDALDGTVGADNINGLGGNDTIRGFTGDDTLNGGDGVDNIQGGQGNDVLIGGASLADLRDVILGGAGHDRIDGGYGNDELRGDAGNDTIAGGFGADTVIGADGNDQLTGGAFGDVIFGGAGNDFINGGFGSDRVNGGAGADRFFHLGIADHGSDFIQDYDHAQGDLLVFGGNARRDQFQINTANTPGAGDAGIAESFIVYRPTGQIMWALIDGAAQDEINLLLGGQTFDLT